MKNSLTTLPLLWFAAIYFTSCERSTQNPNSVEEENQEAFTLREASGVATKKDTLYIVSDGDPNHYYKYPVKGDTGILEVDTTKLSRVEIHDAFFPAYDLESIEFLADGRLVVLSERLRMLIDEKGNVVSHYEDIFDETAGVGLEGVAVRAENNMSKVAVLWEGGYMSYKDLPASIKEVVDETSLRKPLYPRIFIHDLPANTVTNRKLAVDRANEVLQVKTGEPESRKNADPQRFRASDLVWHKLNENEWGFILLLTSSNPSSQVFEYCWLQRFDMKGNPVGKSYDIYSQYPKPEQINWEGLDWLNESDTLVLIHDKKPDGTPHVLILPMAKIAKVWNQD